MKKRSTDSVNLTPMIDIVFQMIIFFVFTVDLDREKFDTRIEVPDAEQAPTIEEFEPSTIYVQVLASGDIQIGTAIFQPHQFRNLIRNTVQRHGRRGQDIPVMIYADGRALHSHLKQVMDIASEEGLWKINIVGMVERTTPVPAAP